VEECPYVAPFEAVTATFAVKASIFVLRQWHRHRTILQRMSARYRKLPEQFHVPAPHVIGVQATRYRLGNVACIVEDAVAFSTAGHNVYVEGRTARAEAPTQGGGTVLQQGAQRSREREPSFRRRRPNSRARSHKDGASGTRGGRPQRLRSKPRRSQIAAGAAT
jgi:Thymidylate synthase complementing protein